MALTRKRALFGISSICPYNYSTGLPYGLLEVIEDGQFELAGENIELRGGSSPFPWAVEDGVQSGKLSFKCGEFPDFLYELCFGVAPTQTTGETAGNVTTAANKYGSSVIVATTGIASVAVKSGSEANLKFGKYVIKAITSTTLRIYAKSVADLNRGTDVEPGSDLLVSGTSALTITSGSATDVTALGIQLNGGSGTIGMTANDTAEFEIRPINSASSVATLGAPNVSRPYFGAVVMSAIQGTDDLHDMEIFKLRMQPASIPFASFGFSMADLTADASYDVSKAGVWKPRHTRVASS